MFSFFILFFLYFPFQANGSSSYVDVDLKDPEDIHTLSTQEPFFVISNSQKGAGFDKAYYIQSPRIIELNKLIVPVSLYGRHCSTTYAKTSDSFPPQKIHAVLPTGTVLTVLIFFTTLQDVGWVKQQVFKIIHDSGLRKFIPGRGGPKKYYIAKDESEQELGLFHITLTIMKEGSPIRLGQKEAIKVLETFKGRNQKHQQVLLIIETHKEYWSKCNYGGVYKKDNSHNPLTALKEMKKIKNIHSFQNIKWNPNTNDNKIEVTVDYLALAYLIYRSHELRIKDIVFSEGF